MKKFNQYFIPIFLYLIFIISLFFILLPQQKLQIEKNANPVIYVTNSTTTAAQKNDPKIMTKEERRALKVSPTLKVEVLRRSATGTPTDYRITK